MTRIPKRVEISFLKRNIVRKFKLIWLSSLQSILLSVNMNRFVKANKTLKIKRPLTPPRKSVFQKSPPVPHTRPPAKVGGEYILHGGKSVLYRIPNSEMGGGERWSHKDFVEGSRFWIKSLLWTSVLLIVTLSCLPWLCLVYRETLLLTVTLVCRNSVLVGVMWKNLIHTFF